MEPSHTFDMSVCIAVIVPGGFVRRTMMRLLLLLVPHVALQKDLDYPGRSRGKLVRITVPVFKPADRNISD